MVYICKPKKVSIYVNTGYKTIDAIKAETGCDAIINGGLYDMDTFTPEMHLKVDGKILSTDEYTHWGFGWNTNDLSLVEEYSDFRNYIRCVCLVRDGKAEEMYYDAAVGGYRPRTAIGVFPDGRVWLYADTAARSPEQLQKIALLAGVDHAIMLDGGGSTQCVFPEGVVKSPRIVHNYICVWSDKNNETGGDTMFKIALGAGHGLTTAGKRCMKSLDPNETREWWLNDRICDKVERLLKEYEGYQLLRLDDSDDGADDVALKSRVDAANAMDADFYLSVHHNAGINGGSGGGICAYSYYGSAKGKEWRDDFYDALIAKTGLKGNRSQPKLEGGFYVLKYTNAPAVLLELGFMDSKTDVPIILTEKFADQCAAAIVEVLVKRGALKKKKPTTVFRVQVGAFGNRTNAEALVKELKADGYEAYITFS